ncbi:hypothetical protein BESB_074690 [Besnoitia besnoiti]|uniref:Uncharacterized protein n=1 Tax=Besnoitia besnoiti TaxID=94643 RepID=A0A2A9MFA9_BESBE|nr:uncharacterized protein BESB_074690 [Besnoitia besnoiti]PFH34317.1 hypothetical protein BESB_074690 [Besnoitia besnoiti]
MAEEKLRDSQTRSGVPPSPPAVELHLEERLQQFLMRHDFRTLESIAAADLRALGLNCEDTGKIHAACASALLSESPRLPPLAVSSPFSLPSFALATAAELLGLEARERRRARRAEASSPFSASASAASSSPSRPVSSSAPLRQTPETLSVRSSPYSSSSSEARGPCSSPAASESNREPSPCAESLGGVGERDETDTRPQRKRDPVQQRHNDPGKRGEANSHDRPTSWTSGSANLDRLLGGRGWRAGEVVELFGAEGGAALTEVLIACLAQALLASERASVLFVSCRGFLPLARVKTLLSQSVKRRQSPLSAASSFSSPAEAPQEGDGDLLSLLRRFRLATCCSLEELPLVLQETKQRLRRSRQEGAAARKRARHAPEPNPEADEETDLRQGCGARQVDQREDFADASRKGAVQRASGEEREAKAEAQAAKTREKAEDGDRVANERRAETMRGRAASLACGTEAAECTPEGKQARPSAARSPSSGGGHLAAVAIDGISLLLLPHAMLDGNAVLQEVWRLLRQFAVASSSLVLTTNHTVSADATSSEASAVCEPSPRCVPLLPFALPPLMTKRPGLGAAWSRCAHHQQLQVDLLAGRQRHRGRTESPCGSSVESGYLARVAVIRSPRQAAGLADFVWLDEHAGVKDPPLSWLRRGETDADAGLRGDARQFPGL